MALPQNYQRLGGSERRPSPTATRVGPADSNEQVEATIVLRRRVDSPPLPRPEDFPLPPNQRRHLSSDEFAARFGASAEDIQQVTELANSHGLVVTNTNAARRAVTVSGTVEQMSKTFAVELAYYDHDVTRRHSESPQTERYRGRDGFIHVPRDVADLIIGVFGLDNRRITKRNSGVPPNTTTISVTEATSLYNFPTNSAQGQTIAIFSETGYQTSDITQSFSSAALTAPSITDVSVDSGNDGSAEPETTQDIYIAASAAPGANIAVYFTASSQQGWVDLIQRVVHPDVDDPTCSVLSSSFFISNGDDAASLTSSGVTTGFLAAVTAALQDAALQHVTVCIASGDTGTDSQVGDGKAHVQYPASDPWVLSIGGTTVS
jgi:kumamolisin